ncbi:putative membrane protein [Lyngbya aestuarii BL J]|uniref:Putative membrane protein n=1 Tax=Lyngbya aestuarii BL J TaxID=1348334 RepID=U7QK69_9CYAN|nr:hypothetical protein [Lyngbya aestuarii]ERT08288.1 putative membrane protein [Lyngbya aestuarii BL J]
MMYLTLPSVYLANSGVPLFTQSIFYQVLLLIPIIFIEAFIHRKILKLKIYRSISIAFSTNLISTFIGVLLLLIAGSIYCCLPFYFPLLPLELIVTLIPMFFVSFLLELALGYIVLKEVEKTRIHQSFFKANLFTYLMLETLAITQLIRGYWS